MTAVRRANDALHAGALSDVKTYWSTFPPGRQNLGRRWHRALSDDKAVDSQRRLRAARTQAHATTILSNHLTTKANVNAKPCQRWWDDDAIDNIDVLAKI